MIKLKKILAGVLSAAMMLSSIGLTALAEQTEQYTTPATIDMSRDGQGSLTIHKYEFNGQGENAGTGMAEDTVPDGAKPLKDVFFTIYRVAGSESLNTYYGENPEELPSVDSYLDDNGAVKWGGYEWSTTKSTNEYGVAKFDDLKFGIYLVMETSSPDAVTSPVAPFLVSIPMTTVDGSKWLYDVEVFPKNGTTYGGIELEKKGKTGSSEVKLSGVTFVLQKKIKNGNGVDTWVTITKQSGPQGDNTGIPLNLITDTQGKISVDGLSQGTYRFIEKDRGNNGGYIMDGASTYEFTIGKEGKATYDEQTQEGEKKLTITVTNEKPDMKKEVKKGESWGQEADYSVGDKIEYKITVDVPANITKLKEFKLTDTPTHLADNKDSIKITCASAEVAGDAYEVSDATGDGEGAKGFVITFKPEQMNAYAGKQLVITYNATLLKGAVTTTVGNPNEAVLEYSNEILPSKKEDPDNPNVPEEPGEPDKDRIEDHAVVYTFKLNIKKTNESEDPLKDVEFDLYKEVPDGTEGIITDAEAAKLGLDTSDGKKYLKLNTEPLKTGEDGTVAMDGLADDTYYLVETKTNDGYNLLSKPVKVKLEITYTTEWTEKTEWETNKDGRKFVKHEIISKTTTFNGNDTTEGSQSTDGILTQKIVNRKGFTLPTTGGMGTVIFTVGGIALALMGLLLVLADRRRRQGKRVQ